MKRRERGFTLVELLVVIAILGVLAGIAVPRVMGALETSRRGANIANQAIVQSAVERWNLENSTAQLARGTGTNGAALPTAAGDPFLAYFTAGRLPPINAAVMVPAVTGRSAVSVASDMRWGLNSDGVVVIIAAGTDATALVIWTPGMQGPAIP